MITRGLLCLWLFVMASQTYLHPVHLLGEGYVGLFVKYNVSDLTKRKSWTAILLNKTKKIIKPLDERVHGDATELAVEETTKELSLVVSATASPVRREEATKKLAVEGAIDLLATLARTSGMTKIGGFWRGGDLGRAKEMKIQGHTAGLES